MTRFQKLTFSGVLGLISIARGTDPQLRGSVTSHTDAIQMEPQDASVERHLRYPVGSSSNSSGSNNSATTNSLSISVSIGSYSNGNCSQSSHDAVCYLLTTTFLCGVILRSGLEDLESSTSSATANSAADDNYNDMSTSTSTVVTVFAPLDSALEQLLITPRLVDDMTSDSGVLSEVVLQHVVFGTANATATVDTDIDIATTGMIFWDGLECGQQLMTASDQTLDVVWNDNDNNTDVVLARDAFLGGIP